MGAGAARTPARDCDVSRGTNISSAAPARVFHFNVMSICFARLWTSLNPTPVGRSSRPSSNPGPVSAIENLDIAARLAADIDPHGPVSVTERMPEAIGYEFGEDEPDRAGTIKFDAFSHTRYLDIDVFAFVKLGQWPCEAGDVFLDIDAADVLVFVQLLLHDGERLDAPGYGVQLRAARRDIDRPASQGEQAEDDLQIVLYPVMDFSQQHVALAQGLRRIGERLLRAEFRFLALGDVDR